MPIIIPCSGSIERGLDVDSEPGFELQHGPTGWVTSGNSLNFSRLGFFHLWDVSNNSLTHKVVERVRSNISVNVLGRPWNAHKCRADIVPDRVIQIKYLLWFYKVIYMKTSKVLALLLSHFVQQNVCSFLLINSTFGRHAFNFETGLTRYYRYKVSPNCLHPGIIALCNKQQTEVACSRSCIQMVSEHCAFSHPVPLAFHTSVLPTPGKAICLPSSSHHLTASSSIFLDVEFLFPRLPSLL